MPEVISKYPEITLKVLKEAGASCGPEFQPRILTKCPAERFCSLPTGEICVYGIDEIPQATQISSQEILKVISEKTLPTKTYKEPFYFDWFGIFVALLIGLILGLIINKRFFRGKEQSKNRFSPWKMRKIFAIINLIYIYS